MPFHAEGESMGHFVRKIAYIAPPGLSVGPICVKNRLYSRERCFRMVILCEKPPILPRPALPSGQYVRKIAYIALHGPPEGPLCAKNRLRSLIRRAPPAGRGETDPGRPHDSRPSPGRHQASENRRSMKDRRRENPRRAVRLRPNGSLKSPTHLVRPDKRLPASDESVPARSDRTIPAPFST